SYHVPFSNLPIGYSKNHDAAKKFLGWIHSKDVYDKWFVSQKGFSVGPTTDWEKHKLCGDDPIMLPYKQAARTGRFAGYQWPSTPQAAEDERWLAFVLLVPTLVLLGMFIAYPFLRGILLSVTDARVGVPGNFVGLANFYKIFNDGIFRTSVYNTFLYTGVTTVFKLALGL